MNALTDNILLFDIVLFIWDGFMTTRIQVGGLSVATGLWQLVDERMLSGIGIKSNEFWAKFESIVNELTPINKALLVKRELQC